MSVVMAVGRCAFGDRAQRQETVVEPITNKAQLEVHRGPAVDICRAERARVFGTAKQRLSRLKLLAGALVGHDLGINQ